MELMTLAGNTYQAEVLRHLHDTYGGHLQDTDIGVTRRLWNELGQTAGCHIASVAATLSHLENDGRVVTEFGLRGQGGRCRVSVLLIEEPPEGVTVYKGRVIRHPAEQPAAEDGHQPTAEEIATWLLKKTVEASQVPVLDIIAAQHHAECLNEDLAAWQELATEYEERIGDLRQELTDARAQQTIVIDGVTAAQEVMTDNTVRVAELERDLNRTIEHRDVARKDVRRLRELFHRAQAHVEELTAENAELHSRVATSLSEDEARELRQKLYGTERSLEESRSANQKAERKIAGLARERDEVLDRVAEAHSLNHAAKMRLQEIQSENTVLGMRIDELKTALHDRTDQLRWTTEHLAELIVPGTVACESDGIREVVRASALSLVAFYTMWETEGRAPTEDEITDTVRKYMTNVDEGLVVNVRTENGRVVGIDAKLEKGGE